VVLLALLVPAVAAAGKLDDAGRATRQSPAADEDRDESDDDEDSGAECGEACAELFVQVLLLPWSLPRAALGSERQLERWYDDYPYATRAGYVGLRYAPLPDMSPLRDSYPRDEVAPSAQRWAAQARIEGGANLDGVGRAGALARLLTPAPVELEASWLGFLERDGAGLDWAHLSGLRLNWRFAEASSIQFRTGIGYQHWFEDREPLAESPLTAEQRSRPGADLGYGFDAFVAKPFLLSAEGRVGVLGNAFSWQARATLGALFGPVEWYAGYDEVNIGGVSLGGPVTGLRGFL
jgi:hypothetical protein